VLAAVALFLALGGAAYAGSKIGTKQIKTGAVTSKKLAKGAVKTKNIADGAVKGPQVDEATLETVPSAANADRAGGLTPAKFSSRLPIGSALRPVATVGTIELRFGCDGSGRPLFGVVPAAGAPAQTTRASVQLSASSRGSGQGTLPQGGIDVLDGSDSDASFDGSVDSLTDAGGVTTVQWAARSTAAIPSPNPDASNCLFWGTALSG
jgi:hypothetical protein